MIPSSNAISNRAAINGANAQHSTGPRTPAGKQRSSLNALRHGLAPSGSGIAGTGVYQEESFTFWTGANPAGIRAFSE
jgi:hypothetical protein